MDAQPEVLDEREQRLNEILGAYLEFADAGCAPDRDELLSRYPNLAAGLHEFFMTHDRVCGMANGPARSRAGDADSLGDYERLEWIGGGGMGDVYKAWHKGMKRWVALKKIKAGRLVTPDEVRRFREEIEVAASLEHPHIVPIHDVREHRGLPFFSMPLFETGSLQKHLNRFQDDPRGAATLIADVARAMQYAHQFTSHLDLKPANILLDAGDQPHIADFGLAKRLPAAALSDQRVAPPAPQPGPDAQTKRSTAESARPDDDASRSTHEFDEFGSLAPEPAGASVAPTVTMPAHAKDPTRGEGFRGTIGYAPVERASTAADIYGLGATLYRLLTGRKTFEGKRLADYIQWFAENEPARPRELNPKADVRLEAICMKCLRKKPEERYASAEALAEDLERWLAGEPPLAWEMPMWLRAWRTVRRNALMIFSVLIAAFSVATAFFAWYYFDPERVPRELEREARRGRVVLIGETGPPRWSRWTFGGDAAVANSEVNQAFSYTSLQRGRLELMKKAPGARFRLTAQVRHDKALDNNGAVGIYIGHVQQVTEGGIEDFWCDLMFADRGQLALAFTGADPKHKNSACHFSLQRAFPLGQNPKWFTTRLTTANKRFPSAQDLGAKDRWRDLALEVTPEKVRVFWEGDAIGALSAAELGKLSQGITVGNKIVVPELKFAPEGGLGLYVVESKASFRNVTIEPLE